MKEGSELQFNLKRQNYRTRSSMSRRRKRSVLRCKSQPSKKNFNCNKWGNREVSVYVLARKWGGGHPGEEWKESACLMFKAFLNASVKLKMTKAQSDANICFCSLPCTHVRCANSATKRSIFFLPLAEPASTKENNCLNAAKACNLNDTCKKYRSAYINPCTSRVSASEICNKRKCHKALRHFFDKVISTEGLFSPVFFRDISA